MRYLAILVLILGVALTSFPQNHTWITYFSKDGWTYEYDPVPEGIYGYVRNVKLKDPYAGAYVMTRFQYMCSSKEVKVLTELYFDTKGFYLDKEELEESEWLRPIKNSTVDQAMKGWCKYAR